LRTRLNSSRRTGQPLDRYWGKFMNNIIYLVGLVVIILFILGFFGLR